MVTIRNIRWTDQYAFAIVILQITDGRFGHPSFLKPPSPDRCRGPVH